MVCSRSGPRETILLGTPSCSSRNDKYALDVYKRQFLQFFLIIIRLRSNNLSLDLFATFLDVLFVTGTVYDGRVILGNSYLGTP